MLIKGLEYDHAIVLDTDQHEPASLYEALTRARTTLTVISRQPELLPNPVKLCPVAQAEVKDPEWVQGCN